MVLYIRSKDSENYNGVPLKELLDKNKFRLGIIDIAVYDHLLIPSQYEVAVESYPMMIKMGGLENWLANQQKIMKSHTISPESRKFIEKLTIWAKKHGYDKNPRKR